MQEAGGEFIDEFNDRGKIPKDLWGLLLYATFYDFDRIKQIKHEVEKNSRKLVAVYPGVPELMKGIDVSKMEYVGSIMDGGLYLK